MPKLTRLAEKALNGDEDAMDELELMAPKGVLDDMTVEEFAEKMVNDEEFAEEIYDAEGTSYGKEMKPDKAPPKKEETITVGKVEMSTMDVKTLETLDEAGLIDMSKELRKAIGGGEESEESEESEDDNPVETNEDY